MKTLIRKCRKCNIYTLEEICPKCGGSTEMAIPMKYSPADKFQKYRIKLKESDDDGKNNI
ncbi:MULTISPECIES: RNA-protein complex protein Nop10 [Acidiplasma]|jgi:H/ACA ribonucleoprotein complex subunit 3|uniref:Ribosome biogenesis protein Nop10 n=2 Tax=Acidiplasma TaxID=507753 RepID=A0A0Q0RIC7_9ARCH|nr:MULTISPECIES: RNA-protein complex protein Nop10 [Acidiplasma]KJE48839.1 ribosome biogenesis protein Nop10 [Acidiplasma sp. MBA-1]KPV47051.1 ribosome biogenesis protein [Acidiplasma aeolicum]KQB34405.1 ribosome biogenesis protein [Acidiplasma aeolicum]KQB35145.1 ribosome biogenesis protein [Acidiplasma cupricumulans]WMT54235.1 MAG: RNA-protein complex protein Nop10 [Acidiplasma sp.]